MVSVFKKFILYCCRANSRSTAPRAGCWGWSEKGASPRPHCEGHQGQLCSTLERKELGKVITSHPDGHQGQFCSTLERKELGKVLMSLIRVATFLKVEGYFVLFNQLRTTKKINISKECVGMHSYVQNSWGLLRHSRGSHSAGVMGQIPNHSNFILLHLDPICSVLKHPRRGNRRESPRSLCRAVWSLSFSDWLLRRWNLQG